MTAASRPVLVGILLAALAAPAARAQVHIADSLRGGTSAGNAVGGHFDVEGWHVDGRTDRIWFALPRLVSGSVEFTLSNVTRANLDLADHEVFTLYEAGYGMAEPLRYAPEFRENHNKCMIRIYGNEPGREGLQKLMWNLCPSGAPGYGACTCALPAFFAEPYGGDGAWDGSPQRLRVEWGGGVTRYLRNGGVVHSIDWSASGFDFGPSELHVTLGSPRNGLDTVGMPIGAVYSDLVIDGVEGPLATCAPAPPPDAPPAPPPDAPLDPPDAGSPYADAPGAPTDGRPGAGARGIAGGCGCRAAGVARRAGALARLAAAALALAGALRRAQAAGSGAGRRASIRSQSR